MRRGSATRPTHRWLGLSALRWLGLSALRWLGLSALRWLGLSALRWLGLSAVAVALAACQETVAFQVVNADAGNGSDAGGPPSGVCFGGQTASVITATPESSLVIVALDRSTSMDYPFGSSGSQSKLQAAQQALLTVVQRYQAVVLFSYVGFPGTSCFPESECCSSIDPSIPGSGSGGFPLFQQAITACDFPQTMCAVGSQRPTAAALVSCARFFGMFQQVRNRSVLLVTDGDPGCPGASSDACTDAQFQVSTLANSNKVTTNVVGLGPPANGRCLNNLALTGMGTYYATHPGELDGTLDAITHLVAVEACHLDLSPTPSDFSNLVVLQNEMQIPRNNVDGWQPNGNSPRITLNGKACETLLKYGTASTMLWDCGTHPTH